jgi:hypothetical protein
MTSLSPRLYRERLSRLRAILHAFYHARDLLLLSVSSVPFVAKALKE